jgi:hypothetical protein
MSERESFTSEEARRFGEEIGIDWRTSHFDVEQFRAGMDVELEHGLHDPATNVTDDDPVTTARIAHAHLKEFSRLLHAPGSDGGAGEARLERPAGTLKLRSDRGRGPAISPLRRP